MKREEARSWIIDHWGNDLEDGTKQSEVVKICLSALSAGGEYIKKEDLLKANDELWDGTFNLNNSSVYVNIMNKKKIDDLPTYSFPDSAENKGEWIIEESGVITCNNCGTHILFKLNFCPNCGADMRGKDK